MEKQKKNEHRLKKRDFERQLCPETTTSYMERQNDASSYVRVTKTQNRTDALCKSESVVYFEQNVC